MLYFTLLFTDDEIQKIVDVWSRKQKEREDRDGSTHLLCSFGDHCSDSLLNSFGLFVELFDPPYLYMYYIYFTFSSFTINENFNSIFFLPLLWYYLLRWCPAGLGTLLYLVCLGVIKIRQIIR